jgi:hypothetical protein
LLVCMHIPGAFPSPVEYLKAELFKSELKLPILLYQMF